MPDLLDPVVRSARQSGRIVLRYPISAGVY
jgi:hypothetical protein